MFLSFQSEFEHHCQGRDTGTKPLGAIGAQTDGREGRLDRVGGSKVGPVLSREIVERLSTARTITVCLVRRMRSSSRASSLPKRPRGVPTR